ncbi:hypothetical protein EYF80_040071 [Liparis tanakae]|uniref:Uncharacterized protein n=1 Tax=Liparis tanakae TaxID=230148 RepID=A0A4Z2GAV1_9TELE|nr:hypothetical protein EYF80_040071 [Liparis tanakae]
MARIRDSSSSVLCGSPLDTTKGFGPAGVLAPEVAPSFEATGSSLLAVSVSMATSVGAVLPSTSIASSSSLASDSPAAAWAVMAYGMM